MHSEPDPSVSDLTKHLMTLYFLGMAPILLKLLIYFGKIIMSTGLYIHTQIAPSPPFENIPSLHCLEH